MIYSSQIALFSPVFLNPDLYSVINSLRKICLICYFYQKKGLLEKLLAITFICLLPFLSKSEPPTSEQISPESKIRHENSNLSVKDSSLAGVRDLLNKSNPDDALPILFDLLKTVKENSNEGIQYRIYITEAYREKQEYQKGKEILYDILKLKNVSAQNKVFAYNRMAAIYHEQRIEGVNVRDSVTKYSNLCIELSQKNSLVYYSALSQNELGYLYLHTDELDKALDYFQNALKVFSDLKQVDNYLTVCINLSKTYNKLSKYNEASKVILDALKKYTPINNKHILMRLYEQLSYVYQSERDFESAYNYLLMFKDLQRDFYTNRIDKQINEMSAKYSLQQKDAKIAKQKHKSEMQRQQKIYLIIILIILIIIFIIVVFNFRLKKKVLNQKKELVRSENENLKNNLDFKNKELTANAISLAQMSDLRANVVEKLRKALPYSNKEGRKIIHSIVRELENGNYSNSWKEFELCFKSVHSSFYKNLQLKFPDLTPNELRICAFLKLNMSTKDIAILTSRSNRTIDSARLSIRKKMNLNSDTNLVNFLMGI